MQLKHPVNFVCPDEVIWPELRNWTGERLDDQVLSDRSGGILHSWLLRTYYQLGVVGIKTTVTSALRPDAINLVSVRDFGKRQRDLKSFVVVPQGDAHHSQMANFRILQNGVRPVDDAAAVIWHWPQPGIIPRDPDRQHRMEQLCYKGRVRNLYKVFRSDEFVEDLKKIGVTFEIDAYDGLRGEHNWNDYAHSDAVLAIRNLTIYDMSKKPASKLVNAWFADIPALMGPEPAFRELGTNGEDYLEIRTPQDAIDAITTLKSNPDLYHKIIANGRKRREAYSETALTQMWLDTLNGPIAETFEAWQRKPAWAKAAISARGILRENKARAADRAAFTSGPRLLDGAI